MELKAAFVIICLCALAITSTEAGIPKCCIKTIKEIPYRVLLNVQRWSMQQGSGACDIPALILNVKGLKRPICAHPKVKRILMRLPRRMKQNK
ncbi:C-C motif chemokine 27a [Plectropomus leopardus]|uniref:C-C motif chemokine 27a n=1 Tax=Plectropomus leopardus TaxID=160734 RepID=UPI001C4C076C|nr:C-C motif chemokine 27a [Plectropomus leopardus]